MTPRVSVVLAVYNGERHLEASVRSILDQSFRDFELIVVDDGSNDGTTDILARAVRSDGRTVIVRQENRGLTVSLNRGIGLARGCYIARQDADDISLPARLQRQVAYLDAHPAVGALGTGADVIDGSGKIVGALGVALGAKAVTRGLLTLRSTPVHGSMMMRKSALDATGGYREAFPVGQDFDLWLRLSSHFEIDNLSDVLYQWRLDHGGVYVSRRATQLQYAGIALAFARERASGGHDSYDLLDSAGGDLDRFVARYRLGAFVHSLWGELWLRGLGNRARVRDQLRRAVLGGHVRPWTLCLLGWTHLGLPWPGGRPLALVDADKDRT
jgi:glycosyltransferase involved in cell wall biosynthesis